MLQLSFSCSDAILESDAELDYARYSDLRGSILNVLMKPELLDEQRRYVCFDISKNISISPSEIILETKLALIMWLNAIEDQQHKVLDEIFFEENCDEAQSQKSLLNIYLDDSPGYLSRLERDPSLPDFEYPFAACNVTMSRISCQNKPLILAIASTFSFISYTSRDRSWLELEESAKITINPHINWLSLYEDLLDQNDQKLAQEYKELLNAESTSLPILLKLVDSLMEKKYISKLNNGLNDLLKESQLQRKSFKGRFRQKSTLFYTLLHELGHTIGLQHADHPISAAVTGNAAGKEFEDSVFKTKDSVMAYGDPYLYLTDDDIAGVRAVARNLGASFVTK